jgi:hypothetical protein
LFLNTYVCKDYGTNLLFYFKDFLNIFVVFSLNIYL